ncbi:hypothetical protein [Cellulosimicrobium sp. Marseille-Q4280]|uniref:hypothetical protein n=1 Tax=Cellulosimicrobium sp. Marseille-Q4280 TaxID=2937992 RepID=UPI00203C5542|nr:hypothetical protein [Cellulosimicrobium sp. Marseille-Q4280]
MTTNTNSTAIRLAAQALAARDGLDYFERENQAGIADLLFVSEAVLRAAREAGDGAPDADLASDPIAVGAAARTLAVLEGNAPARLTGHLDDARAMLAALATKTPALAAA